MSDLIDTTEMYLRTVFELEEEGIVPLRARIAERLGHSGPTVSQTVARMERAGLVHVSGDRHLQLTPDGRAKATRVMRKHRLAERLLVDVIGLEWEFVHEEACRWEHVMSERVERKLVKLLGNPTESPYGNPIPGLDELGQPGDDDHEQPEGMHQLSELALDQPRTVFVHRIGESVQNRPGMLSDLQDAGIHPGRSVKVRLADDGGLLVTDAQGHDVVLAPDIAEHVYVTTA